MAPIVRIARTALHIGAFTLVLQLVRMDVSVSLNTLSPCEPTEPLPTQKGNETAVMGTEKFPIKKDLSLLEQQMKRTAVVWTSIGITTECEAARLRHLVETAGMDVWVLQSHYILARQGRHDDVEKSREYMASIPGLHQAPQGDIKFMPFDDLAGASKSSVLRFLADHSEYDYAWIVESDLFYTGPWEEMFKSAIGNDMTTDFLTSRFHSQKGNNWWWMNHCQLLGRPCAELDNQELQVHWMFARVSRQFATSFLRDLYPGLIGGLHEAVVGAYCSTRGFSLRMIDQARLGMINVGHDGKNSKVLEEDLTLASRHPKPGQLVHPVKCIAYEKKNLTFANDIENWTKPNWATAVQEHKKPLQKEDVKSASRRV